VGEVDQVPTVTIAEAARLLGVGEQTIRRRIKRGELVAERTPRPQGHEWRIRLDPELTRSADQVNGAAHLPDEVLTRYGDQVDQVNGRAADQVPDQVDPVRPAAMDPGPHLAAALALAETLVDQLAAERARTAQLEHERFGLAGQLGFLQAQLHGAQEQIKLLTAPRDEPVPTDGRGSRPWWERWLWWRR
jgi:excisionase family DNA binding protein